MKRITSKELIIMALLAGTVLIIGISSTPSSAYAKATVTKTDIRMPLDIVLDNPCADGGAGEDVHLTGELHHLFHVTLNSDGGDHVIIHTNSQGLSGTGLTTGDKYRAQFVNHLELNGRIGVEQTFAENIRFIAQGDGNNWLAHITLHFTVHPDGTVTALHGDSWSECR